MVSELAFLGSDMEFLMAEQVSYSTGSYGVHLPLPFQVGDYLLNHSYEYSPPPAPPDQFLLQSSLQAHSNPNPYLNYFCLNPSKDAEYVPLPPLLNQYFNDLQSQTEIPPYVHPPDGSNYSQPCNSSFSNDCLLQPYRQSTNLHAPTTPPVQPPYYHPCSIPRLPINQPLEIQYCNPHISPVFEDSTIENYGGEANLVENCLTEIENSVSVYNCKEAMVEHEVFDNSPEIKNSSCEVNFAENYLSVVDMADTVLSVFENPSFWSSNELVNGSVEVVMGVGSFRNKLQEKNVMENEDFGSRVEDVYTEDLDQWKNNEDDDIDGGSRIGEIELMRRDLNGKEKSEGTNQESVCNGFSNSPVMYKVLDSSPEGENEEYDAETDILDDFSRSCANASENCGKIDECNLNEFFYMRQASTVRNFFDDLIDLIPMVNTYCEGLTESMVVDIFIGGLRQDIRNYFAGCYPSSMLDTLELAELEEKNIEALRGENSMENGIGKHVKSVDNDKVRDQILRSVEGVRVTHKGDVVMDTINAELFGKGVDIIGEIEENEPGIRDYNLENFNESIIESSKPVDDDNDENEDLEVTNMETLKGLTCNDESDVSEGSGIVEAVDRESSKGLMHKLDDGVVHSYHQEVQVIAAESKYGANVCEVNTSGCGEKLYPGWRYDQDTGQWCQVDGYDTSTIIERRFTIDYVTLESDIMKRNKNCELHVDTSATSGALSIQQGVSKNEVSVEADLKGICGEADVATLADRISGYTVEIIGNGNVIIKKSQNGIHLSDSLKEDGLVGLEISDVECVNKSEAELQREFKMVEDDEVQGHAQSKMSEPTEGFLCGINKHLRLNEMSGDGALTAVVQLTRSPCDEVRQKAAVALRDLSFDYRNIILDDLHWAENEEDERLGMVLDSCASIKNKFTQTTDKTVATACFKDAVRQQYKSQISKALCVTVVDATRRNIFWIEMRSTVNEDSRTNCKSKSLAEVSYEASNVDEAKSEDEIALTLEEYVITMSTEESTLRPWNQPDGLIVWKYVLVGSEPSKSWFLVLVKIGEDSVILVFGSESLIIALRSLDVKSPAYIDLDMFVYQVISFTTTTLYFDGALMVDDIEFQTNNVLYPEVHPILSLYAPIVFAEMACHEQLLVAEKTNIALKCLSIVAICETLEFLSEPSADRYWRKMEELVVLDIGKLWGRIPKKIVKFDPWGQGSFEGGEFVTIDEMRVIILVLNLERAL